MCPSFTRFGMGMNHVPLEVIVILDSFVIIPSLPLVPFSCQLAPSLQISHVLHEQDRPLAQARRVEHEKWVSKPAVCVCVWGGGGGYLSL